ncbi:hypothetical protein Purlil1_10575 [Purpureocillium lilacinum]|uniref:Secreted protein n=1 Tax=Purpureocillium lilacinum TaxID=33203 RepID=A0ABR0BNA7_PURLI|nr:hypothetical protein Purlil1_10575 [Purpureocillium lilacinum]
MGCLMAAVRELAMSRASSKKCVVMVVVVVVVVDVLGGNGGAESAGSSDTSGPRQDQPGRTDEGLPLGGCCQFMGLDGAKPGGVWRSGVQQRQRTDAPPPTGPSGCQTARGRTGGGGGLGSLTPGLRACLVLRTSTSGWCGFHGAARSPARWADAFSDDAVAVAPWATVNAQWPQSIELASAAKRCARARIRPARPTRDAPTWPLAAIMGTPCPRWAGELAGAADASKIDSHPP